MAAFLDDISGFYGDGSRNEAGQTLEEFLEDYDPHKYDTPSCTTDTVIFADPGRLGKTLKGIKVLLVKRSNHPSIGCWALPGGFAEMKENLEDTARREVWEETGLHDVPMEQMAVYGDYKRDPRCRVITTAYVALVDEKEVEAGDDAAEAAWCDVSLKRMESGKEGDTLKETYALSIRNEKCELDTTAIVMRSLTVCGLIREEKFTVKERGKTACDHAAIIVQAMLLLMSRIG